MTEKSKKSLWIALAFAIILGAIWQFYPLKNAQERLEKLPLEGADFKGKNIPLTSFEAQFFHGVGVIKRLYRIGDDNIFLTVLDGTYNRHVVHDPYYCFRGSGWDILGEKQVSIPGGSASLVQIQKGDMEKEALFWFSDGTDHFSSPFTYWKLTTLRRLTLGHSGAEPVLIMVQPAYEATMDWKKLPEQFPQLYQL